MSEIINFQDMLMKTVDSVALDNAKIITVWKNVVSKVRSLNSGNEAKTQASIGERLAAKTHVVDVKNGIILIEAEHSGWIQYLRMYQKFILTGLNRELPELKIKNMAYRVAGSNARIHDNYDEELKKSRRQMMEKLDKSDAEINKFYKNKVENSESSAENQDSKQGLPPELLAKFDSIRNSMLTNSKN